MLLRFFKFTSVVWIAFSALSLSCSKGDPVAAPEADEKPKATVQKDKSAPVSIENGWDPRTGKGNLSMETPEGHLVELKMHQGFSGYTGGLVLGSKNGSAYTVLPAGFAKNEKPLAIWCAQDESIFDHKSGAEYSYGWSENFGRGPDGIPLRYLGGEVLEETNESLALVSFNESPPYRITRVLLALRDGTLLFKVKVENHSAHPVELDFWTGDDPWVGTYGTSDGDVGWHGKELILNEKAVELDGCLGIADYSGGEGKKSITAANVFCLGPDTTPPTSTLFANSFAHKKEDIDPSRKLDSDTLTAFNIGWRNITLPEKSFELSYALGMIVPERDDGKKLKPVAVSSLGSYQVSKEKWSRLYEVAKKAPPFPKTSKGDLRFDRERVTMEILNDQEVEVRGTYFFKNETDKPMRRHIYFPFAIDDKHPYPHATKLSIKERPRRMKDGILFPLRLDPKEEKQLDITYRQKSLDRRATYIVTSARSWDRPITSAHLEVIAPKGISVDEISYPLEPTEDTTNPDKQTFSKIIESFYPEKEFEISWSQAPAP